MLSKNFHRDHSARHTFPFLPSTTTPPSHPRHGRQTLIQIYSNSPVLLVSARLYTSKRSCNAPSLSPFRIFHFLNDINDHSHAPFPLNPLWSLFARSSFNRIRAQTLTLYICLPFQPTFLSGRFVLTFRLPTAPASHTVLYLCFVSFSLALFTYPLHMW